MLVPLMTEVESEAIGVSICHSQVLVSNLIGRSGSLAGYRPRPQDIGETTYDMLEADSNLFVVQMQKVRLH